MNVFYVLVVQHLALHIGGILKDIWGLPFCYKLIDGLLTQETQKPNKVNRWTVIRHSSLASKVASYKLDA